MLLLVVLLLPAIIEAVHRPNHFSSNCQLCSCFVVYTDRDLSEPIRPYAMAENGYDVGEDQCLAQCLRDERCKAVVYGIVGGREVFTCEMYDEVDSRYSPKYTPYVNTYVVRAGAIVDNAECHAGRFDNLLAINTIEANDQPAARKLKYAQLRTHHNPFAFGR